MKNMQNLHTHSDYCDGKNTPEDMVRFALEKGFDSLGFSGHSYMFYSPSHSMSLEGTEAYRKEILRLKKQYAEQIRIFLGLEVDRYSEVDLTGYEYLIGAFHYFKFDDEYVSIVCSAKEMQRIIDTYFGGDGLACAREYYRRLAELPEHGKFDILGHIDLITQNCEQADLFDVTSKEYLNAAFETVEALSGKIPFFEVNTGAIARGYRTTPYPSLPIVKELRHRGFGAIISSDCHDGRYLDCAFDQARELLLAGGFRERYIFDGTGYEAAAL